MRDRKTASGAGVKEGERRRWLGGRGRITESWSAKVRFFDRFLRL